MLRDRSGRSCCRIVLRDRVGLLFREIDSNDRVEGSRWTIVLEDGEDRLSRLCSVVVQEEDNAIIYILVSGLSFESSSPTFTAPILVVTAGIVSVSRQSRLCHDISK